MVSFAKVVAVAVLIEEFSLHLFEGAIVQNDHFGHRLNACLKLETLSSYRQSHCFVTS